MNKKLQKIHFIAIGGSVMHNLAIALHQQGFEISGSDDGFFEPSKSRLERHGLLPDNSEWDLNRITPDLDAIILGMHAKKDNIELLKAQELNIPVYSFPEFIYKNSEDKQRVVIAGSHGKTSITSMIMHVLHKCNRSFDYAVGASIDGFDTMVKLSSDAPVIIIEGDEYLSSPLDPTPKFIRYQHHMGVLSGIAWDHINVFPTQASYVDQFKLFSQNTPKAGTLIYNQNDTLAKEIVENNDNDIVKFSYEAHASKIVNGKTFLITKKGNIPLEVFGAHNLSNIAAAKLVCDRLYVNEDEFYEAISSFKGAGKRLELIGSNDTCSIYKDFAHSPSKLEATCKAVKNQFSDRSLVACLELHTFSSLNKDFLNQYKGTFEGVDFPVVYFNPDSIAKKGLESISFAEIEKAFECKNLLIYDDSNALVDFLKGQLWKNKNLLLMSSGSFNNTNLSELTTNLLS